MSARGVTGPSAEAQAIASLVRALEPDAAEQLRTLLAHDLEAPSAAERRETRLWLLMEIVASGTGERPLVSEYEDARAKARARGLDAPSSVALINAFGSWLAAVRAAMRMHFDSGRVPSSNHHAKFRQPPYTRDEIVSALVRCHRALGGWPTQWEYAEWAALDRRLARIHGKPEPRNPSLKQIRRRFGKFSRAVEAAEDHPFGV